LLVVDSFELFDVTNGKRELIIFMFEKSVRKINRDQNSFFFKISTLVQFLLHTSLE